MSAHFGLFLGEDRIPVINWINRHGPPEGRDLRFTVPTEVKAKLEANKGATYRLERDGQRWDFELLSVTQHGTGTNGVPAIGRVKTLKTAPTPQPKPTTGVGIAKVEAEPVAKDGGFTREKSSLKELLLKKKEERRTEMGLPSAAPDPSTLEGVPTADDPEEVRSTAQGVPSVAAQTEEE